MTDLCSNRTPPRTPEPDRILVVDDVATNRHLIATMLRSRGYSVSCAESGEAAQAAMLSWRPQLVLLDVAMPGMDGYQVCSWMRQRTDLCEVPVIFLSALTAADDKVRAFEAGAVDYVTKPFQREEVLARVDAQVRISGLQRQLAERLVQMQQLQELKDSLVHMVVHDLRSPLTGIVTSLELALLSPQLLPRETEEDITTALGASQHLMQLTNSVLDISRIEAGSMPVRPLWADLAETARSAIDHLGALLRQHQVLLEIETDATHTVHDPDLVQRVFANLLANAVRHTPPQGRVTVRLLADAHYLRAEVVDEGCGIAAQDQQKIFDKFGQVEGGARGSANSGLGLTFCALALEAHEGRIGVESAPGQGSKFWFELPCRNAPPSTDSAAALQLN